MNFAFFHVLSPFSMNTDANRKAQVFFIIQQRIHTYTHIYLHIIMGRSILPIILSFLLCVERDLIPAFVTFLACLFAGVELGIVIGATIDLAILIYLNARPAIYIEYRNVRSAKASPKLRLSS